MSTETLKRFDRIVAIQLQLQSKSVVKAQDLADRFQVSLRTIYRDIRTLEASGVPIVGESGIGYSLMEGYRLPPVMFTKEEASSFVAAEKLMQKFTDKTLGAHYGSAMLKVKAVLRSSEKDWVHLLESQIHIAAENELFNANIPNALEILLEGIAEKKQIQLWYHAGNSDIPLERTIEPVGIFHENNYWYMLGYCHLRKDYRNFRTDRIQQIKKTKDAFTQEHGTLDQHRNEKQSPPKTKVVIRVDKKVARFIGSGKKYQGLVAERKDGDMVELEFNTPDLDNSFARWFIMFADYADIVEPEALKTRMQELLTTMKSRLG